MKTEEIGLKTKCCLSSRVGRCGSGKKLICHFLCRGQDGYR